MKTEFCGVKGAREQMGIPYVKLPPSRRSSSDNAAYRRAKRRAKRTTVFGLPVETSTIEVNDSEQVVEPVAASPSLQSVPCPERECNGVAIAPINLDRNMLVRCQTCGCRFNPSDPPAELVDARAAEIFARNQAAKEASKGAGQNRDLVGSGTKSDSASSHKDSRLDGATRHVYRQDRRRRGSDTHQL